MKKAKKHKQEVTSLGGLRKELRARAHALMAKEGLSKVNRSYFRRSWRDWASRPWPV